MYRKNEHFQVKVIEEIKMNFTVKYIYLKCYHNLLGPRKERQKNICNLY